MKRCLLGLLLLFGGCSSLPKNVDRPVTTALSHPGENRMGKILAPQFQAHPEQSGFRLLEKNLDALVARAALAKVAEHTIDLQYYLYYTDETGALMTHWLLEAADRGVRVRMLLDDMDTTGRAKGIATLDQHPNIEIRLFNPFTKRGNARYFDFLTNPGRVSRRMHNKSFIVDNVAAIVGGRNIGDEYFINPESFVFADLDVMAIGPVVQGVSESFDSYWNSDWAYPITALTKKRPTQEQLEETRQALQAHATDVKAARYTEAVQHSQLMQSIRDEKLPLIWAPAEVYYDLPDKLGDKLKDKRTHLGPQVLPYFENAQQELLVMSPYFVPGKKGSAFFGKLSERGVSCRIITNSLDATDVWLVHRGYAPYRKRLLSKGVELYETKTSAFQREMQDSEILVEPIPVALHAKALVVDRRYSFIGSVNLDPRSSIHNTEIGVVIDSPELAEQVRLLFEQLTHPANSFQTILSEDKRPQLRWISEEDGKTVLYKKEPASGWLKFKVALTRLLPIENQL